MPLRTVDEIGGMDGLSAEERRARRAARRRQVRRRRVAALSALLAPALVGCALAAAREEPARATGASRPVVTAQSPARSPARQSPAPRLGNGKPVTFAFGGDVHFESPIRERLASSPTSVLAPMAPILRSADLAVVNLETAVTERGAPAAKDFTFRAPASAFDALLAGGVDVASVANNHAMDYGVTGLNDTLAAGRKARMPLVGAGRNETEAYAPYRVRINGQRIAVIGATQVLDDHLISAWSAGPGKPGLASAKREARLLRAVREARTTTDTLVVFLHWGVELYECATSDQRSLASKLVAAGADIVVGAHAHVLAGAGRLRKALVAYGLGNFVFYAFRESTTRSGVLLVTATGRRIDGYEWVPARISGGIPHPIRSGRSAAVAQWRALRSCTGLRR
jgi:poly-gamma-glutamate synthesis protein (capsule biosynthesis protein)